MRAGPDRNRWFPMDLKPTFDEGHGYLVWDSVVQDYLFGYVEAYEDGSWEWMLGDRCIDRDKPPRFYWAYLLEHPHETR